jgi:hypothetical protein
MSETLAFQTSGYGAEVSEISPPIMASNARLSNQITGVLISSTEGSPASPSQWPANGVELKTNALSGLSSDGSCPSCGQRSQFSKMFQGFYPHVAVKPAGGPEFSSDATTAAEVAAIRALSAGSWANLEAVTKARPSKESSPIWLNSGLVASDGAYWTRNTSESRNAADACSLSQVVESEVSPQYFLSARAAAGILRRGERRGKVLPPPLEAALRGLASTCPDGEEKTTPT